MSRLPLRSASLRFAPLRSASFLLCSASPASLRLFLRIASSRRFWSIRKPCDCDNASGPVATVSSAGLALFTIRVLLDLDISPDVPQHAGQPPDRRPSVSLPMLAPARHKVAGDEFFSLWKVALGRACVACLGGSAVCWRMRASTDETIPGVFLVL